MDTRTGFIDKNGSGKDLIELYEKRKPSYGATGTTHIISQTYRQDLGSIFYMYANLGGMGISGNVGANCGHKTIIGTDIGSLFCAKGSVVSGILSSVPTGSVALYACKWVNNNYQGAILKIRRVGDGALQDFYIDSTGVNVGTGFNGTGTSLATWIAAAGADQTAYVYTWYDQSGNGKHATQTTNNNQPTYSLTNRKIFFSNFSADPTSRFTYLIIDPVRVTLLSSGNIPFTIIYKSGLASELKTEVFNVIPGQCAVISIGGTGNNYDGEINITSTKSNIENNFNDSDLPLTYARTATDNEVVSASYDSTTRRLYLNGILVSSNVPSVPLNLITTNGTRTYIGYGGISKFTGSLEYLYVNNTVLNDADRSQMESAINLS